MAQPTHVVRKGDDAELGAVSVTSLTINGDPLLATSILLGTGEVADLNGEADALVLDADADTTISAPTDDQIDIEVNGADDFRITANTFTALSGSTIATNTIAETTAASGVTIDGALIKDGGIVLADSAAIAADVVSEKTSAAGVTIDSLLVKDGVSYSRTPFLAVTADGAIAVPAYNLTHFITKAGVAALTIVDPTATTHDGVTLTFVATTANAHTLSNAAGSGFFSSGGGTKDIATFGGAIGDGFTIIAYQGKWYIDPRGVTNISLG
jgi:hypothetical protein